MFMLNELRDEIACPVTGECNLLLMSGWYQRNRRWQMQHQRAVGELQTREFHFHIGERKNHNPKPQKRNQIEFKGT